MTLDTAKELVSSRYLGRAGLHGVGLRRRENAVCLYVAAGAAEADVSALIGDVRREVSPHGVVVVRDEPASLA